MIVAIIFGLLLSGGLFARTSKYPNRGFYETEVITPQPGSGEEGLQIETFKVKECRSNMAINFLIDNSGSMQFGNKMEELKNALITFANQYPLSGAIALQTYSETVRNRVEFSLFKDSKQKFIDQVNDMDWISATHSKDAFNAASVSINKGKTLFPDYQFTLVFISDGIPETRLGNNTCGGGSCGGGNCSGNLVGGECRNGLMSGGTCTGGTSPEFCMEHPILADTCRCYDSNQDPSAIASLLKAAPSNVRIFTIAFTDDLADAHLNNKLQSLMRSIASPGSYYLAPIESELTDIIDQIANRICTG